MVREEKIQVHILIVLSAHKGRSFSCRYNSLALFSLNQERSKGSRGLLLLVCGMGVALAASLRWSGKMVEKEGNFGDLEGERREQIRFGEQRLFSGIRKAQ